MDADLQSRLARALAPAYDLDGEIGRGGMAIVYRARDTRLKRAVAIKLLPPELAYRGDIRTRFLREAEMAARLSHPNIVPIYSVDERDGLVYFVMGLVDGGSVGDRVRREGALPITDARRILREVGDALAYAHARGVIHRDIKPDNILIESASGRAMVTDFGIARAASEDDGGTRLTATGLAIGTPAYMSPEQCAGDRAIDGRSDLYSLGAVAYQLLGGEPPFVGGNTPSMMMRHVSEPPMPLRKRRPDVPSDLERIVMKLLEKDPADRFADGATLVAALDGAPVEPVVSVPQLEPTAAWRIQRPGAAQARSTPDAIQAAYEIRDRVRETRAQRRARKRGDDRPLPDRIRRFRQSFASWLGTSAMLFGINYMTGDGFWWCVFPILGIGVGVAGQAGRLWADGIPLRSLLSSRRLPDSLPAANTAASPELAPGGAVDPLPDDAFTGVLRQARTDRATIRELLSRMSDAERRMMPDVEQTADALFDRIVSLNAELRRIEPQLGGERVSSIDQRIAGIEQQAGDRADRERLLNLLRGQRDKLAELETSRSRLLEQYESAGLLLQNLGLDLLKVRSSGLESALSGLTSVTQEARALSREIGYAIDAAAELRELDRRSTGSAR